METSFSAAFTDVYLFLIYLSQLDVKKFIICFRYMRPNAPTDFNYILLRHFVYFFFGKLKQYSIENIFTYYRKYPSIYVIYFCILFIFSAC